MSTKDYNKFKEILDKFPLLEERTDNFIKEMRRFNFVRMKDELESLAKRINLMVSQTELKLVRLENLANSQKVDKTNEEVRELQESHKWLSNQVMLSKNLASPEVIGNLKTQVDKVEQIQVSMKKAVETVKAQSTKSTDSVRQVIKQIASIEARVNASDLDKLGGRMEKIREMIEERFNLMMKLIDRKCDREELISIDKKLHLSISEISEELPKFAEKDEVVRRILVLEKHVKKLLDRPWHAGNPQNNAGANNPQQH
jgi:hypothetical protein